MVSAWVKVIVLTLAECVAPEGKTVCQEQATQYYFLEQEQCVVVLEQLLEHRDSLSNVIVNRQESSCLPTAINQQVFQTAAAANQQLAGTEGWGTLPVDPDERDFMQEAHDKRLEELPECDDEALIRPCKIGEIIIEEPAGEQTEVWKRGK